MKSLKISNRKLGEGYPCFIVAEIGVNHNQDINLARKSIIEAANVGADAVKFQTWKTENIIIQDTEMAEYQKKNVSVEISQFDLLKSLELPYEWHFELKDLAEDNDLIFFSTMEDKESVDFLIKELKIPLIKVGSGDLTNYPLLKYTAKFNIPIILSTGMSTLGEIQDAVNVIKEEKNDKLVLLHCTSQYPCPYNDVNLSAMNSLKECFKTIVGFSDHTLGIEMAIAARALGAVYIEKHFTLNKSLNGPDHNASLEPIHFKKLVEEIRNVETGIGNGFKIPTSSELNNKKIVVRKIVASRDIKKDEPLNETNLAFKRANFGLESKYFNLIKDKKANKPLKRNEIISLEMVK